jgi:hypothetical protein
MAETVRFMEVLRVGGQPKSYLPLADPRSDKSFMRAAREHRIVSLKQTPTGTHKDFGVVGVLWEKYVSYLIFPKSLARFENKRVIGIKYEQIEEVPMVAPHSLPKIRKPKPEKKSPAEGQSQHDPRPLPKKFAVQLQITATKKMEVTIEAFTRKEAQARAIAAGYELKDFSNASVVVRASAVREQRE